MSTFLVDFFVVLVLVWYLYCGSNLLLWYNDSSTISVSGSNLQSFLPLGCEGTSAPTLEAVATKMRSTHPVVRIATNSGSRLLSGKGGTG